MKEDEELWDSMELLKLSDAEGPELYSDSESGSLEADMSMMNPAVLRNKLKR